MSAVADFWEYVLDIAGDEDVEVPKDSELDYLALVLKLRGERQLLAKQTMAKMAKKSIERYLEFPTADNKGIACRACEHFWKAAPSKEVRSLGWSIFADHPTFVWEAIKETIGRDLRAALATVEL